MISSLFRGRIVAALVVVALAACTDGVRVPTGTGNAPAVLAVQPQFSERLMQTAASTDAVAEAFDRVDRFRLIVRRSNGEVVADVVISVTPGQAEYELSAEVPIQGATETFQVDVIAMVGDTELFRSENVQVQAVSGGVTRDTSLAEAPLDYVGPGATAATLELDRDRVVLEPGGQSTLVPLVRDTEGATVPNVPLGWSSSAPSVVAVDDGVLAALSDGTATVTASTPNGIAALAFVSVLGGEIAFVRDGTVHTATLLGTATSVGPGSQPAYTADGSVLMYTNGGRLLIDGTVLLTGTWPSGSPDGTKIAYERAGNVFIVNVDGSSPTEGPQGRGPQWRADGSGFVVRQSGLEDVSADGSARSTLVAGDASRPAVAGGRLAWVSGGVLRVASADGSNARDLASGVAGRPALSPDGRWAIAAGEAGLWVVATDGSGEPVLLPHGAATQPAWRGNGLSTAPAPLTLTGLSPETPAVGDEVTIEGSGFDILIPENNSVTFTTAGADATSGSGATSRPITPAPVLSVTATGLTTRVPEGIVPGPIEVSTLFTTATFDFDPPPATIVVSVRTTSDQPVEGATVTLTDDSDGEIAALTDAGGTAEFGGLQPGTFSVAVEPPTGSPSSRAPNPSRWGGRVRGPPRADERPGRVARVGDPDPLLEVGDVRTIEILALDGLGNPVEDPGSVRWEILNPERARFLGGELSGRFIGTIPSPAPGAGDVGLRVTVEDLSLEFTATVATAARGFVYDDNDRGYPGVPITLSTPAGEIARQLTGRTANTTSVGSSRVATRWESCPRRG